MNSSTGDFDAACDALTSARDSGVFSAAALGILAPDGARRTFHVGHTRRFIRQPNGSLLEDLGQSITPTTLFDLASLTKPLATTTLIALRLAAGSWRLDQSLRQHLPTIGGITCPDLSVGELISHCSGLPAWLDLDEMTSAAVGAERRQQIQRTVALAELQTKPGAEAVYSDLGFLLLGWALERVASSGLEDLFGREVAAPLNLASTQFRRISEIEEDTVAAAAHLLEPQPRLICATEIWPRRCPDGMPLIGEVHDDNCAALDGVGGHAGLFSNLDDVLSWAGVWLAASRGESGFVPRSVVDDLVSCRAESATTWRGGFDTPSPAGSSAGSVPPMDAFGHLGFTGTSVWISPSLGAVVLLTNRVHPTRDNQPQIKVLRPVVHDYCWRSLGFD